MKEFAILIHILILISAAYLLYLMLKPEKCPKCNSLENYQDNYGTHCSKCRHRISKY